MDQTTTPIPFKAETRQLLEILIHSLYSEREIFLRELISNASDALTRVDFELVRSREVLDPGAELAIRITLDEKENTLTVSDSGIGMTAEELAENLGTIARSGAREFIAAAQTVEEQEGGRKLSDLIGQFGVGFYSAFMVAEWIRVTSRSYLTEAQAASWYSSGNDTFNIEPAEKAERGTTVTLKLKEDASEFAKPYRLREIIRKHSDFIPFPIYIGEDADPANQRTAIWRQSPREVEPETYDSFYHQLTLDPEPPMLHAHMAVDAPVQMYAVLFVPSSTERGLFVLRREPGLKLYARKVLIQEYHKDLLPEYLSFVQGVVDSEDLPLNVSRETIQSNRIMANLKKLVTSKVLDTLKKLAEEDPEKYSKFWQEFGRFIKQGVAMDEREPDELYPLLRFHTSAQPNTWSSLDDYVARMQPDQKSIYYIMGDDERSVVYSPHLDVIRRYGYEALLLTDPVDAFMILRLVNYQDYKLENVASPTLQLPEKAAETPEETQEITADRDYTQLVERFKSELGDQVGDVRTTDKLNEAPARLVNPSGALTAEMQRAYRLLDREFETPKKVMEINPKHPIVAGLQSLPEDSPLAKLVIEQIYEDALLIEGLHPDPASMVQRIQKLMEEVLK
jgi:HSP90 family molecular chaperone